MKVTNLGIALSIVLSSLTLSSQAQSYTQGKNSGANTDLLVYPKNFIGLSTGSGSTFGNLGLSYGRVVYPNVLVEVGGGFNVWGLLKVGIEGNYFLNTSMKGLGFGLGLSRTFLSGDVDYNVNNYPYDYKINPTNVLNLNVMYNFLIKKKHHFYIRSGYGIALNKPYTWTNPTLAQAGPDYKLATQAMNIVAPGGFIFGLGFRFALSN